LYPFDRLGRQARPLPSLLGVLAPELLGLEVSGHVHKLERLGRQVRPDELVVFVGFAGDMEASGQ